MSVPHLIIFIEIRTTDLHQGNGPPSLTDFYSFGMEQPIGTVFEITHPEYGEVGQFRACIGFAELDGFHSVDANTVEEAIQALKKELYERCGLTLCWSDEPLRMQPHIPKHLIAPNHPALQALKRLAAAEVPPDEYDKTKDIKGMGASWYAFRAGFVAGKHHGIKSQVIDAQQALENLK